MANPYSVDLRLKVLDFIEFKGTIIEAGKSFGISRKTIHQWKKIKKMEGRTTAKTGYHKGNGKNKIKDLQLLERFVNENKGKSLKELGENYPEEKVSAPVMRKWLKRIGYSCKKKVFMIQKEMKKKEKNLEQ